MLVSRRITDHPTRTTALNTMILSTMNFSRQKESLPQNLFTLTSKPDKPLVLLLPLMTITTEDEQNANS